MFLRHFVRAQVWTADLRTRLLEDRGATAVEYALMLAFIAMVIFAAVAFLGSQPIHVREGRVPLARLEVLVRSSSARLRLPMTTVRVLALQEADSTIDRLRARRRTLEDGQELAAAREEADAAERRLGEFRLKLDELGRDQLRFEHEIDSMTQKEKAEQTRLFDGSIANAKELEALQHDVANLQKRRSDREDELLVVMEQREQLEAGAAEAGSRSNQLRAKVDEVSGASAGELSAVMAELEEREGERASISAELDPELLELYEDLRRQKKGVGAAALIDGVCQGCHEQLSAMQLDKLKRTEGIRRCEHCRRILVF